MDCKGSYSSDDSSGSLPDLADVFNVDKAKLNKQNTEISRGDIVWAKFKHLYWPALVRAVYPKQKKITIWYADEPGKTFKLPLKNVCHFNDTAMRAKIMKDVREAGCIVEHEGLTAHARRYLNRRYEGYQDDPLKFFDQTYPFFLIEEMLKKDPNADVRDLKIPPLYISHEKKQSIRKRYSAKKEVSDDSEVESTESEGEIEENVKGPDYISTVHKQLQENPCDPSKEEYVKDLVQFILSGQADDYLQKILSKKIPSEHRNNFEKAIKNRRASLHSETFTGPIEDDSKLRQLIFYLLPLYENMKNKKAASGKQRSCRKMKKTVSAYSSGNEKSDDALYVSSVWLPEAIIFAISKVKNISLPEAKKLFGEKCESKTKAIEDILSSLNKFSQECELPTPSLRKINTAESFSVDEHSSSKLDSETETPLGSVPSKRISLDDSDAPSKSSKLSETETQIDSILSKRISSDESDAPSKSSKLSETETLIDSILSKKISSDESDAPCKSSKLSENETPIIVSILTKRIFPDECDAPSKSSKLTEAETLRDSILSKRISSDESDVASKTSKLSETDPGAVIDLTEEVLPQNSSEK